MTDIASLSFQIDTSNVPTATDQLNKLSDAADHVRGSVRFLVGSVGDADQALQQLAASGRASLASFVQISQNLDVITASLTALRGAAADTIGTLGGQGLNNALTTFQQQFAAMATIFGTSTSALEAFNKQAEYLQLNSNQVGSAIQRITQAQQNATPYGQALRSQLDAAGIQVGADPAAVLRQIQTLFASHQLSQQAFNQLQEFLGPIDPATAAAFRNQPYQSVAARRQEFIGQTLDQQASVTSGNAATLSYQNRYNRDAYNDGRPYLNDLAQQDITGSVRSAFIDDLTRRISQASKTDPDTIAQEQRLLSLLQGAQPGSQNAIAAESQFDILNPGDPTAQSTMSIFGRQALARAPIAGTPSWYERFTDQNFQNANTNYIGAAYDQRRANVGHSGFGVEGALEDFALNTDEDSDYILNRLGLYNGPPAAGSDNTPVQNVGRNGVRYQTAPSLSSLIGGVPGMPTIAQLQQSPAFLQSQMQADVSLAGQIGPAFSGYGVAFAASQNIQPLLDTQLNSTRSRLDQLLNGQYGPGAGDAIADQQAASQGYLAQNAGSIGFDQMQPLKAQNFLDSQGTGKAIAQAFIEYYKSLGLDPGRLAGLTLGAAMTGQGGAGVGLTPAEVDAFKKLADQLQANALTGIQTGATQQNAAYNATQAIIGQNLPPDQLQAMLAGQGAYQAQKAQTGDGPAAIAARNQAFANSVQGSFVQTDSGLQGQLFNAQSGIAGFGMDYQARNAMMAQRLYGDDLATAQDNGQTELAQQIQDQIQRYQDLNNTLDLVNAGFDALQGILGNFNQAGANEAVLNAPPGQKDQARAVFNAQQPINNLVNPLINVPATLRPGLTADQQALATLTWTPPVTSGQTAPASSSVAPVYTTKGAILASSDPYAQLAAQAQAAISPWMDTIAKAAKVWGVPKSYLAAQAYEESGGAATAVSDQGAVGPAQMKTGAGKKYGLIGPGYDYRTDPSKALPAMAHMDSDLMTGVHGSWNNPSDVLNVSGQYGTLPQGMTLADLQNKAAQSALANVNSGQAVAGQAIDYATGTQNAQTLAALPYLRTGQTGDAAIASARIVNPNTPAGEVSAVAAQQMNEATASLARAAASLQGNLTLSLQSSPLLAAAAMQGPGALQQAQAQAQANAAAAQVGSQIATPAWKAQIAAGYLQQSQGQFQQQYGSQVFQSGVNAYERGAELQNSEIVNPYQRLYANAMTQMRVQDAIASNQGATPDQIAVSDSLTKLAAQFDILTQKSQEVASGMSQIGGAVSSTLGNLAFSYQQGPGAGLYARKQLSGLIGSAGRSLFDTVIGNPIDQFVTGNLSDAVNTLLGNTVQNATSGITGNATGGVSGSGTSATSQTLGGFGSLFGNIGGNMLLSDGLKGLGSLLGIGGAGAGLQAGIGGFGAGIGGLGLLNTAAGPGILGASSIINTAPAAAAAPGLLSSLGTWISSFFANGDVLSGGAPIPFATGGIFDWGGSPRGNPFRAFAGGDVFTDPTTMPMALIGEAGPEAIMPLRRGADGRLGLAASGGGTGGSSIIVNAPITVGANALGANGQMSQKQTQDLQRQLHQTLTRAVQGAIAEQSRPGGMVQSQY